MTTREPEFPPVPQKMARTAAAGPDMADDTVMVDAHTPATGLSTMPPEIIDVILEFLIPQPPEIGETRPVAYSQLMVDEPWFDFTRCRRGLRSLCLVSRRLGEMARPSLYKNVAILDEAAMLLFFRTLCSKPHYGLWTRYVSCHLTLTENSVIREVRELLPKYLPTFAPAPETGALITAARHFLQMMNQFFPSMVLSEGDFDHVPQALLCFILMFLAKVETVLLQVPISDDQPEYDVLCAQIEGVQDLFRDEPEAIPFQNIRTLLLQGDPELAAQVEDDDCECDMPDTWGAQPRRYSSLFASFPNLTTLEVSSDDGVWCLAPEEFSFLPMDDKPPPPPFMPNIRHIYLHNSVAYPGDLHHLLRNAPQLETLYMAPRGDGALKEMIDDGSSSEHPESLNIALANHAKNLRNLDVSWEDIWGFECLVGPEGRLPSIAEMTSLRTLCVQLALLYGKPSAVLETPLVDLLPPNLVELALEDWWWSNLELLQTLPDWDTQAKVRHYQSQHLYRTTAVRTLTEFARDVRTRMRDLKKVVLLVKIPWTWVLEGAVSLDFHFDVVKSVFLAQGVEFSVKCDEV
ncbi:hypothetical protein MYCTH_2305427 [Thermothelomyces thermophilus ATCC 42464]|uniref:F-box domain-containing protein n=1 Tax=Thermothelomyces thermophilus (strain ATCC 42464 / BCRC 31852 / DSM 1799) TaxID=573729 RepID=G2QD15_THET4|nr:uncharacterized protein MYCTH_2305427 [Thermothelomyces thermophilus ATCC 42464]AEO58233.1 hypothetical protein MYCTH_2305427 [Thermothelomyces thermophilus ATCC 42464]